MRVWVPPSLPLHLSRSCAVLAPPRPRPRPRRALPPPPFRPSQKRRKKKAPPGAGSGGSAGGPGGSGGVCAGPRPGRAREARGGAGRVPVGLGCGSGRAVLCRGWGRNVGGVRGAFGPSPAGGLPGPVRVPRQPGPAFVLENKALLACFPSGSSPQDEGKAQFNALGVIFLVIQGNTRRDLRGAKSGVRAIGEVQLCFLPSLSSTAKALPLSLLLPLPGLPEVAFHCWNLPG